MAAITNHSTLPRLLRAAVIVLLAYMPFHALIYVWAGSNLGHIDWFKIVPQLVIAGLTVPAIWLFYHDKKLRKVLTARKINWLILWYIALHIAIAAWKQPEAKALIAGLMINLRIVAMFLLGQVLAHYFVDSKAAKLVGRVVLTTGLMTVLFGVLQVTILPDDFLRWFGYGSDTIRPYTRLHQGSDVLRFSSTLRGPNPFGAYLAFLLSVQVAMLRRAKHQQLWRLAIAASIAVLVFTFSRSAWIAAAFSVAMYTGMHVKPAVRRKGLIVGGALLAVMAVTVIIFRDNNFIENTVFHTDETNIASTSNDVRWTAQIEATREVFRQPLGTGPGSAGPASVNLERTVPRISENYYLQIAQEVGLFGLVLFVLIFGLVMQQAYSQKKHVWPAALLVSGAGLAIANLLLHVWADDTIGIIWWALAGYYLYLPSKAQPK